MNTEKAWRKVLQAKVGDHRLRMWNAIVIWETIRREPGTIFTDGTDLATAIELRDLGLVRSVTQDDGDVWYVEELE